MLARGAEPGRAVLCSVLLGSAVLFWSHLVVACHAMPVAVAVAVAVGVASATELRTVREPTSPSIRETKFSDSHLSSTLPLSPLYSPPSLPSIPPELHSSTFRDDARFSKACSHCPRPPQGPPPQPPPPHGPSLARVDNMVLISRREYSTLAASSQRGCERNVPRLSFTLPLIHTPIQTRKKYILFFFSERISQKGKIFRLAF